jgi:hypothetical protein
MGVVLTLERASEGCGHSPRRFSGKNAKGHLESLRVLADRAPYPNPNGPDKGRWYDSSYRVLRVTRHPPEGEGPPSRGCPFGLSSPSSEALAPSGHTGKIQLRSSGEARADLRGVLL